MSIEMTVEELGADLGTAIANLPEYEAFESAQNAVEQSEEAQTKIAEFERKRHEFMMARQSGDATQDDLTGLQSVQHELHEIPVMAEFIEAQADLEARLETINEAISEPLAVDFGESAGGCCQD